MDGLFSGGGLVGALLASDRYGWEPISLANITPIALTTGTQGYRKWQYNTTNDIVIAVALGQLSTSTAYYEGEVWITPTHSIEIIGTLFNPQDEWNMSSTRVNINIPNVRTIEVYSPAPAPRYPNMPLIYLYKL